MRTVRFPPQVSRFFEWRGDGTITSRDPRAPLQRAFLETGELDRLLDTLSSTIGIPVERFLIEAQKNVGKALYELMPMRHLRLVPNKRYLRPQWAARLMMRPVAESIAELGDGRLSIESYRAGDSWELGFSDPCVYPMLVGSSIGIFESMEGVSSSEYDYRLEGGDLVIRVSVGGASGESEKRLYLEVVEPGDGPFTYDRCPGCGSALPAAMAFVWDIDKGIITNRLTGSREVLVAVQSFNAMLRELEDELGNEIPGILYEAQKLMDLGRISLFGVPDEDVFWTGHLTEMALHGLGYPLEFRREGDSVSVVTGNTYNQLLYAARVAAGIERLAGRDSIIEWIRREPSGAAYRISS